MGEGGREEGGQGEKEGLKERDQGFSRKTGSSRTDYMAKTAANMIMI